MLRLNNYCLSFEKKIIFKKTSFCAQNNELTVITGESGSGKTTLLNSLCLRNEFSGDYLYNDQCISGLEKDKQNNFLQNNIYFIEQFPCFLNDLTIEEHYRLFEEQYDQYDLLNTIETLDIKPLLKEYPHQLSEGEKKRVALSLGMMRNTQILIVDEATASLNEDYRKRVCELLQKYAFMGHCVIVSSHDLMLQDYASCVYHIENRTIVLKKNDENKDMSLDKPKLRKVSFQMRHYFGMFQYCFKRRSLVVIVMLVLVSLVGICFEFNNTTIATHKSIVNELSSTEIVVYKSDGNHMNEYSYCGEEYPLSQDEVEYLKNIPYVSHMYWRFDMHAISNSDENGNVNLGSINYETLHQDVALFNEDNKIKQGFQDSEQVFSSMVMQTYDDISFYKNQIAYQFETKNGIYLSNNLAKELSYDIKELEGKVLQIPLYIPIANETGVSTHVSENGTESDVNFVSTVKILVKFPISGVLNSNYLYDTDFQMPYMNNIFFPKQTLEDYIEKSDKVTDSTLYYVIENNEMVQYKDELPKEKESQLIQTIKKTSWEPNCYVLKLDDLTHLEDTLGYIYEIGLNAKSVYLDSYSLQESIQGIQNSIRLFGVVLFLIFLGISYQMKKAEYKNENMTNMFLLNMGMALQDIRKIKLTKYIMFFVMKSILSILIAILIIQALNTLLYGFTDISLFMLIVIIGITFISEFLFPTIGEIRRRKANQC